MRARRAEVQTPGEVVPSVAAASRLGSELDYPASVQHRPTRAEKLALIPQKCQNPLLRENYLPCF